MVLGAELGLGQSQGPGLFLGEKVVGQVPGKRRDRLGQAEAQRGRGGTCSICPDSKQPQAC